MESYAIRTHELTKSFGSILAVNKLNLKIPYGKTYGLLGPNGAGKTTTIRMLNGIISSNSGEIYITDKDIKLHEKYVKMISGFLPESPGLYQKLSAREFLNFIGELYYLPKSVIISRVEEILKLFGLSERANDLLEGYSRGMKQKVCLCAALIQDPQIIYLDEPTSNLDPAIARMVKDLIKELVMRADKTIFICTHQLDVAEELCDQIGIINNGILKIEGSPREIIEKMGAKNLEDAYLKVMGVNKMEDLLSWRENGEFNKKVVMSGKGKVKKRKRVVV